MQAGLVHAQRKTAPVSGGPLEDGVFAMLDEL